MKDFREPSLRAFKIPHNLSWVVLLFPVQLTITQIRPAFLVNFGPHNNHYIHSWYTVVRIGCLWVNRFRIEGTINNTGNEGSTQGNKDSLKWNHYSAIHYYLHLQFHKILSLKGLHMIICLFVAGSQKHLIHILKGWRIFGIGKI